MEVRERKEEALNILIPFRVLHGLTVHKNVKMLEFLLPKLSPPSNELMATTFAVLVGDIEIFRQNSGISTSPQFFPQCALAGRLDIFKEVELRGITWRSQENYYAALFTGRVKLLTWLLENDPPDSIREILEAMGQLSAELGKLKTLKWLRGIPEFRWTEMISKHAAIGGHVDILDYIWENGLPIDFLKICEGAALGSDWQPGNEGNLRVLKWARKKKGKWEFFSPDLVRNACNRSDHKILRWLAIHGYILPEHEDIVGLHVGTWADGKIEHEEFKKLNANPIYS
jgi:hypothetical protein